MKIFLAEYGEFPSDPQSSVILAESLDDAKKEAQRVMDDYHEEWLEKDEHYEIEFVDGTPEDRKCEGHRVQCRIREVELKPGVVYTGYYCC